LSLLTNDEPGFVIASEARQSMQSEAMDRHGLRPRDDPGLLLVSMTSN